MHGVDLAAIPRESIERIEITRGNSGVVLYGDGAVGGVINIVTKNGVGAEAGRAHRRRFRLVRPSRGQRVGAGIERSVVGEHLRQCDRLAGLSRQQRVPAI